MIKAEVLLQGGHTVTLETTHASIGEAVGKFRTELSGGWQIFQTRYLIHPGAVSAIRFYEDVPPEELALRAATPKEKEPAAA